MFDLWLRSGTLVIIIMPFALLYLIAVGIVSLTHLSPARPFFASCIGIAGPSLRQSLSSSVCSLRSSPTTCSIGTPNLGLRSFEEADGVRTILRLDEALGAAGSTVTAAAVDYVQSVLTKEWPAMRERGSAAEDLGALRNLTLAVLAPGLTAALPNSVHQAMLQGLAEVRQARLERLTLTAAVSDPLNWLAMLVLGVLTQIAVAVVQLERLRPQALALFVFTTAFAATMVLVGLTEQPLSGMETDAAPLRAALASATL